MSAEVMEKHREAYKKAVDMAWHCMRKDGAGLNCLGQPRDMISFEYYGVSLCRYTKPQLKECIRGERTWPHGVDAKQWEKLACEALGLDWFGYEGKAGRVSCVLSGNAYALPLEYMRDTRRHEWGETERALTKRAVEDCEKAQEAKREELILGGRVTGWSMDSGFTCEYMAVRDEFVLMRGGRQFDRFFRRQLSERITMGVDVPCDEVLHAIHNALKVWYASKGER